MQPRAGSKTTDIPLHSHVMRLFKTLLIVTLLIPLRAWSFDIGLVPLHDFDQQAGKSWGLNISLHGSQAQVNKMRRWISEIAAVPRGMQTLEAIGRSGHKLMIIHSRHSIRSSGKASAPMSSGLIDGRGESVDIFFNFDIPDQGSHEVFDTHRQPIEYTAVQNLYHELAHAEHMMLGTWDYVKPERQAIRMENEFRRQQALIGKHLFAARVFITGRPICPDKPERVDDSWQQGIICF